jgi:hypothetical protein
MIFFPTLYTEVVIEINGCGHGKRSVASVAMGLEKEYAISEWNSN